MSSERLTRLGGLAAMLGGALLLLADLMAVVGIDYTNLETAATTPSYAFIMGLFLLSAMLLLGALIGLYLNEAEAAGSWGFVCFLVAFIGTGLLIGAIWAQEFGAPALAANEPAFFESDPSGALFAGLMLSFVLFSVGWLLFGVATYVANIYPRWISVLLMAGAILALIPRPGTGIVLGLAVALLGFVLFQRTSKADSSLWGNPPFD